MVQPRQHERERVRVEPCGRVALAHAVEQAARDRAQQPVGERPSELRVERAEVVEVDVHQADPRAVSVRLRDRHRKPVGRDQSAGEARERVAVDVALGGRPLVAHFAHQELDRGPPAIGDDRRGALHLGRRAVGAPQPRDEPHAGRAGRRSAGGRAGDVRPLVGMDEIAERPAGDRGRGLQPEQAPQRRVREHHAARGLDHDRVRGGRREPLVALLALAQGVGGAPPLGDVAQRQLQPAVGQAPGADLHLERRALQAAQAIRARETLPLAQRQERGDVVDRLVRLDQLRERQLDQLRARAREQHRGAGARVADAPVGVHQQDAVGRLLGEQAVLLVAAPQRLDHPPQLLPDAGVVAHASPLRRIEPSAAGAGRSSSRSSRLWNAGSE